MRLLAVCRNDRREEIHREGVARRAQVLVGPSRYNARVKRQLYAYLLASENSRTREAILRHRFVYDLTLAAARRGYALQVYLGEVDRDGFDIVLDDGGSLRKVQLKSVLSSTESWRIRKKLLLPEAADAEPLGFIGEQSSSGLGGGVVLQDVEVRDDGELNVTYSYTDVPVLRAFEFGLLSRGGATREAITQVLAKLIDDTEPRKKKKNKPGQEEEGNEEGIASKYETRVVVPRGAFVPVRGSDELLAIVGLASLRTVGRVRDILVRCLDQKRAPEARDAASCELLEVIEVLSRSSLRPKPPHQTRLDARSRNRAMRRS
jgi:hypothetical protein